MSTFFVYLFLQIYIYLSRLFFVSVKSISGVFPYHLMIKISNFPSKSGKTFLIDFSLFSVLAIHCSLLLLHRIDRLVVSSISHPNSPSIYTASFQRKMLLMMMVKVSERLWNTKYKIKVYRLQKPVFIAHFKQQMSKCHFYYIFLGIKMLQVVVLIDC